MVLTAVERRSATLVSADAAGYSRLMAADELATIEAIKVFRILPTDCDAVIDPLLSRQYLTLALEASVQSTPPGALLP